MKTNYYFTNTIPAANEPTSMFFLTNLVDISMTETKLGTEFPFVR